MQLKDRGWCSLGVEALTYSGHCYDKTVWVTRTLFCNSAALCSTNTRPFCLKECSSVTWWTHCPVQTHFMLLISSASLCQSPPPLLFFLSPTKTLPHLFYPTWTFMCSPMPLVELFPSNLSDRSSLALTCSWTIWWVKGQVSYLYGMFHCLDRRVSDSMRIEDSLTHTSTHLCRDI